MVTRAHNKTIKDLTTASSNDAPSTGLRPEATQSVDETVVGDNLKKSDNRFTPPEFIDAVEKSFGKIDFDPCWHEQSFVRPVDHFDVRRGDDGLRDDWSGDVVFVNPPWSAQDKWIKRAYEQWKMGKVTTVICLVPAATSANVFHDLLPGEADIYFLKGRPRFWKEEDRKWEPTMRQTMVVVFGASFEQRSRFSQEVNGLWCVLERLARPDLTPAKRVDGFEHRSRASCAAPRSGRYPRIAVLCSSSAGRPSIAT
jgi:hypothetical protein